MPTVGSLIPELTTRPPANAWLYAEDPNEGAAADQGKKLHPGVLHLGVGKDTHHGAKVAHSSNGTLTIDAGATSAVWVTMTANITEISVTNGGGTDETQVITLVLEASGADRIVTGGAGNVTNTGGTTRTVVSGGFLVMHLVRNGTTGNWVLWDPTGYSIRLEPKTYTSGNVSITTADSGRYIILASAVSGLTVPTDATHAHRNGHTALFANTTGSELTISAAGVTLTALNGLSTSAFPTGETRSFIKVATNSWHLIA